MRHGENGTQHDDVLWLQPGSVFGSSLSFGFFNKKIQLTHQIATKYDEFDENRKFISSNPQENFLKTVEIYQKPCETPKSSAF